MITGGTGSFGHTVLKHFLTSDIGQIRIFSRDEKKQDDMRHDLQAKYPEQAAKVKFCAELFCGVFTHDYAPITATWFVILAF